MKYGLSVEWVMKELDWDRIHVKFGVNLLGFISEIADFFSEFGSMKGFFSTVWFNRVKGFLSSDFESNFLAGSAGLRVKGFYISKTLDIQLFH